MEYMRGLRDICDRAGWLLMVDEVQCGLGRTGKWFGYQHAGIRPDVVLLAKGLASGVPIGVCLAGGPAAQVFQPGTHGSTFGGNPLACAAALATLDTIEEDGLMENAERVGGILLAGLREALVGQPGVVQVRGQGLMIGVELDRPCGDLVNRALAAGLLINVTMDKVIRLLPPLVINEAQARQVLAILVPLVREFLAQAPSTAAARA
jgi:acetylornithine aminotransferase